MTARSRALLGSTALLGALWIAVWLVGTVPSAMLWASLMSRRKPHERQQWIAMIGWRRFAWRSLAYAVGVGTFLGSVWALSRAVQGQTFLSPSDPNPAYAILLERLLGPRAASGVFSLFLSGFSLAMLRFVWTTRTGKGPGGQADRAFSSHRALLTGEAASMRRPLPTRILGYVSLTLAVLLGLVDAALLASGEFVLAAFGLLLSGILAVGARWLLGISVPPESLRMIQRPVRTLAWFSVALAAACFGCFWLIAAAGFADEGNPLASLACAVPMAFGGAISIQAIRQWLEAPAPGPDPRMVGMFPG